MALFEIKDLSFSYLSSDKKILKGLNARIEKGSFNVICGMSGSGKTTFLRLLKSSLAPNGTLTGKITFEDKPIASLSPKDAASRIGFVMQSPERQIVTDKVWHELTFGLESIGASEELCRLRSAEVADYFGLSPFLHRDTHTLSGGQKQLLCLASVMAMEPEVLILDEPTAQLDPIAAADFLSHLSRLHRDFGTTIIISEHHLELVLPEADTLFWLKDGMLTGGSVTDAAKSLKGDRLFCALPAVIQAGTTLNASPCPVSVAQGRSFLADKNIARRKYPSNEHTETALICKDICFTYSPDRDDVLKNCSFEVKKGEIFALLGANGSGKSTLLSVIAGLKKAYRGKVKLTDKKARLSVLPQDPQLLFSKESVLDELKACSKDSAEIEKICAECDLTKLLDKHPYDLSGGEQQRAALAMLLLLKPDILMLDEPTKGLDAPFKAELSALLKKLSERVTFIAVSHDTEFCAMTADRCALLFDGNIALCEKTRSFFLKNRYYTTQTVRLARTKCECITAKELCEALEVEV